MAVRRVGRTVLPLGLAGTAIALLASVALSPEVVVAKPAPDKIAAQARKALDSGQIETAVELGEKLVAANPREARFRTMLGQAYLRAGRFESAAQALDDAMQLGDTSARTALGLALANAGLGRNDAAAAILSDWRDAIPAADLGLAYAMAGDADHGAEILANALRKGENTPKLRQNLAYTYALGGRWNEARIMASQDVPIEQLDARISKWASQARPEDSRLRVSGLLGAPMRRDNGMPAQLALSAMPQQQQGAAQSVVNEARPATAMNAELPPVPSASLAPARELAVATAVVAPPATGAVFAQDPVVEQVPTLPNKAPVKAALGSATKDQLGEARPKAKPAIIKSSAHAVQLGSFFSEQGARRAWGQLVARNPELRGFKMVITAAKVRGKAFWRVAAEGLDSRAAGGLCAKVKERGGVCFAYAITGKAAAAPAFARVNRTKVPTVALNTARPAARR